MFRVALICEGPADQEVIQVVLDYYLDNYVILPIQPPLTAIGGHMGYHGGGWKGVRSWCQNAVKAQGGFGGTGLPENADLVLIQVDADVALDSEVGGAEPCPPPQDTCKAVKQTVASWAGWSASKPEKVVICVPSMASETWAFAALFPDVVIEEGEPPIECRQDIKELLRKKGKKLRPKLVVMRDGRLKNQSSGFAAQASNITKNWTKVLESCTMAAHFASELKPFLGQGNTAY